jgi:KTSC domain
MERVPVVSSVISEIGYEPSYRTLEIMFRSGAIYLYYFVPQEVHRALMDATSHGTYFNQHIKAVYDHHRIAEPYDKPKARPRKPGGGKQPLRKRR